MLALGLTVTGTTCSGLPFLVAAGGPGRHSMMIVSSVPAAGPTINGDQGTGTQAGFVAVDTDPWRRLRRIGGPDRGRHQDRQRAEVLGTGARNLRRMATGRLIPAIEAANTLHVQLPHTIAGLNPTSGSSAAPVSGHRSCCADAATPQSAKFWLSGGVTWLRTGSCCRPDSTHPGGFGRH